MTEATAEKAQFKDGEPTNLPAAALDALEWLEWLRGHSERTQYVFRHDTDSQERLARAVATLRERLEPYLPEQHLDSGEKGDGVPVEAIGAAVREGAEAKGEGDE